MPEHTLQLFIHGKHWPENPTENPDTQFTHCVADVHEIQLLGHVPPQVLDAVLRNVFNGHVMHWLVFVAEQVKQLLAELQVMHVVPESNALP